MSKEKMYNVEKVIYGSEEDDFIKKTVEKLISESDVKHIMEISLEEEEYLENIQYQILRTLSNVYNLYPEELYENIKNEDVYSWMVSCGGDLILKDGLVVYYIHGEAYYSFLDEYTNAEKTIEALNYIKKSNYISAIERNRIDKLIKDIEEGEINPIELY